MPDRDGGGVGSGGRRDTGRVRMRIGSRPDRARYLPGRFEVRRDKAP